MQIFQKILILTSENFFKQSIKNNFQDQIISILH